MLLFIGLSVKSHCSSMELLVRNRAENCNSPVTVTWTSRQKARVWVPVAPNLTFMSLYLSQAHSFWFCGENSLSHWRGLSSLFFFYLFVKNTALFHAAREKGKQSSWNLERCQDIFSTQLLAINKTDILYLGHYSYVTAMLFCCCCCLFVLNKIEAMLAHTLY